VIFVPWIHSGKVSEGESTSHWLEPLSLADEEVISRRDTALQDLILRYELAELYLQSSQLFL
jgi:hypothetical protein